MYIFTTNLLLRLARTCAVIIAASFASAAFADTTNAAELGGYQGQPDSTWDALAALGIQARTFEQNGLVDPSQKYVRRYLQYIPSTVNQSAEKKPKKRFPLMIALHGANLNAETFREFDLGDRLEKLAEREKFIVVYGNAHYLKGTNSDIHPDDPYWANSGYWRTCVGAAGVGPDFVVDDVSYIRKVIANAIAEGLPIDLERIYVVGMSNGGEMAQRVAREIGHEIAGAGTVMPVLGMPATVELQSCKERSQAPTALMFIYSPKDTLLDPIFASLDANYAELMLDSVEAWKQAFDIDSKTERRSEIPNKIFEGKDYTGDVEWVLATQNSHVIRYDYASSKTGANFANLVILEAGGHAWPNEVPSDYATAENPLGFGLKNQDINAEEVLWEWLKDKKRVR